LVTIIQKREKGEKMKKDKILIMLCSFFVLLFGALIFILPQKDFSEGENRYLTRLEAPSAQSLFSGEYTKKLSAFYSDQFPLRSYATALYSVSEKALGKREINGVIQYQNHLVARSKEIKAPNTPIKSFWIDSKYSLFKENPDALSLYYRTDHHRTAKGAYNIYVEICEDLKITPYPEEYFSKQKVCSDFCGTAFQRSCLPKGAVTPDTIELWRYSGDNEVKITVHDTNKRFEGFYRFEKLEAVDKYSVLLGGNYAHASVYSDAEKPSLLIIKDSFANAVIPFLSLHFNIDLVDPRYATQPQIKKIFNEKSYSEKIIIACAESFKAQYNS
jgi:hypothetical protein